MKRKTMWIGATVFAVVFGTAGVQAQNFVRVGAEAPQVKDTLFAGTEKFAQGATNVTEVNLDKNMLGMVKKNGDSGMANKMDFIVVHTYEYDKPGMYKMQDLEQYRQKLRDGSWNCFVHSVEKDESTDICTRTLSDNETKEFVVMTAEPKELTFVHMQGRMSLDELQHMGGMMPGMSAGAGNSSSSPKLKKKDKSDNN